MVFVYALSNEINSDIYIGISKDVERRLGEHNSGKSRYTASYKPWKVFFVETNEDYVTARKREVYFKTTNGRRELRKKLIEFKLLNTE